MSQHQSKCTKIKTGIQIRYTYIVICVFYFFSCGPKEIDIVSSRSNTYVNNLKVNVALFAKERNGRPLGWCSGFLIEKRRGLFGSARHCMDSEGINESRIFFNGKIYEGVLIAMPRISDVSVIKIKGSFNPDDFPEPYTINRNIVNGETVFIRGIHVHSKAYQEGRQILPIHKDYYKIYSRSGSEMVFDNLEANVTNANLDLNYGKVGIGSKALVNISSTFIDTMAKDDHEFPFSGLSGGPLVDSNNNLVGVISNQLSELEREDIDDRISLISIAWRKIRSVPVIELERLMADLQHIR